MARDVDQQARLMLEKSAVEKGACIRIALRATRPSPTRLLDCLVVDELKPLSNLIEVLGPTLRDCDLVPGHHVFQEGNEFLLPVILSQWTVISSPDPLKITNEEWRDLLRRIANHHQYIEQTREYLELDAGLVKHHPVNALGLKDAGEDESTNVELPGLTKTSIEKYRKLLKASLHLHHDGGRMFLPGLDTIAIELRPPSPISLKVRNEDAAQPVLIAGQISGFDVVNGCIRIDGRTEVEISAITAMKPEELVKLIGLPIRLSCSEIGKPATVQKLKALHDLFSKG